MTINNLQYLRGFFEACFDQDGAVTIGQEQIGNILNHINGAITEATTPDKVIPALQPVQIPLFPPVPFQPYQPMPGITPFYPVQPTVTPNEPINRPITNPWETPSQWPGINDEQKYRWGTICSVGTERHDMKYGNVPMPDFSPLNSIRDPFELDASAGSTTEISGIGIVNPKCFDVMESYQDPLPKVSADKLAAIMRDESRAKTLEERRARAAERSDKLFNLKELGRAKD